MADLIYNAVEVCKVTFNQIPLRIPELASETVPDSPPKLHDEALANNRNRILARAVIAAVLTFTLYFKGDENTLINV